MPPHFPRAALEAAKGAARPRLSRARQTRRDQLRRGLCNARSLAFRLLITKRSLRAHHADGREGAAAACNAVCPGDRVGEARGRADDRRRGAHRELTARPAHHQSTPDDLLHAVLGGQAVCDGDLANAVAPRVWPRPCHPRAATFPALDLRSLDLSALDLAEATFTP